MAKTRARFRCTHCEAVALRWLGRCPECREWDTLVEADEAPADPGGPLAELGLRRGRAGAAAVPIAAVAGAGAAPSPTGVTELDRVLDGGLVPGSVTLVGGPPGIGKSTLLLQVAAGLADRGARCLLVSGEESASQVHRRAVRLGAAVEGIDLLAETSLPATLATVGAAEPGVLLVDSVQTLVDPDLPGAAGSVSQVRGCAQRLVDVAKALDLAVVMTGHVTKEGELAGPRSLEHVVDTVVSFEGDRQHGLRFVRAVKHRFGGAGELGLLEMRGDGLLPVPDASGLFLTDRRPGSPGSVVAPVLEGGRPLLVEVQALVTDEGSAPMPRRSGQGVDGGRLSMLVAVLGARCRVSLGRRDTFVSVAGGMRVAEPGLDLAVALALAGSLAERPVDERTVAVGEVGLGGEVRRVSQASRRLSEAGRLGFDRAIVPEGTPAVAGIEVIPVADLASAMAAAALR